jgi:hypothetical protein
VSRRSGRWPAGAWAHPKRLVIEEPWLVNGGHGASLRHHNSACGRVPGRPPHRASPTSTAGHHQIMIFCLYEPYYNTIITTQPRVTTFGTPTSKCWPHTPARKPHMYVCALCMRGAYHPPTHRKRRITLGWLRLRTLTLPKRRLLPPVAPNAGCFSPPSLPGGGGGSSEVGFPAP